jgi:cytochrome b
MDKSKLAVKVWDLPLRLFHWALVIAVAVAFLSSEEDSALNQWHVLSGWTVAILIIFRLLWGFVGGEHSRFTDFIRPSRIGDHLRGLFSGHSEPSLGHNPLGAISVILLLALAAATVWTGAGGMEDVHEIIGWTLLGMVAVHIAAIIIMSLLERENLVRAMISGDKPARRHPGASSARPPSAVALIVVLAVVAGTAYAILQYDPQAFTLRSADAFEHRDDAHDSPSGVDSSTERRD